MRQLELLNLQDNKALHPTDYSFICRSSALAAAGEILC